jgi:transposase
VVIVIPSFVCNWGGTAPSGTMGWGWHGLTDIHQVGNGPGKDVQNGDCGKKKSRARRSFPPEFKAEIVERCPQGERSIAQGAKDFNLVDSAVGRWVEQADIDSSQRDLLSSGDRLELQELRRENRCLQSDADLLKQAIASSYVSNDLSGGHVRQDRPRLVGLLVSSLPSFRCGFHLNRRPPGTSGPVGVT